MATATDNEVLEAFLVEAGELLDALGDQLVGLETQSRDGELLNSVFRTFHTLKGGAGFLAIRPMVELCHHAEELLNDARNQRFVLQPPHIDLLLQGLDVLQGMMEALRNGGDIPVASTELMRQLQAQPAADAAPSVAPTPALPRSEQPPDAVEAAFLAMLDEAATADGSAAADDGPGSVGDGVSDEEFEHLLDELHGDGRAPGAQATAAPDSIDDSEFEALLDTIYGKGGAPGKSIDHAAHAVATPAQAAGAAPTNAGATARTPPGEAVATHKHRADTTVRVDTDRIDALVNAVGELVLVRNRLTNLTAHGADGEMERAVNNLDRVAGDLQVAALRMRMQPIGRLFQRFPRIVRDLARKLDKQVALEQHGEDTNLDRTLVESLADPLIHLLRNAIDHGLEDPDTREQAGKPRQGTVTLGACQEGERILISIGDDGRGMDPDVLRRKAVEKGLINAEQARMLEPAECHALIFRPGFSTRSEISDISGRGVGMDVVKTNVASLGGTIDIESTPGTGTTIRIAIPLTLAIMRVLMVRIGERPLALPLANVIEVFELDKSLMRSLDGRVVVAHRNRPLPLRDLAAWGGAGVPSSVDARMHVVVVRVGHQQLGLLASELFGREEVMVKPLGSHLKHLPGIAGATITGNGRIALVLDLVALAESPLSPPLRMTA
ncbi:MAG TPA: chemotaxis protein CheA [Rhodanobacteraceae bacterium]|nr:chemotaxis protein CheA [Oleiagrimonas sp.]HET9819506.1 chemotaxis protein CheA [Rhodanobacteraceae bacterium]